jgi:arylsulfatase A-like enzyme/Flp pilus assembly protein TadD
MSVRILPIALAAAALVALAAAGCRSREEVGSSRPPDQAAPHTVSWPDRPDVVLVTLDTLRADAPGFGGNRRVETPVLDRLASQGMVFDEAHAHNVVTLPSHANILTGLYPYQHGLRDNTGFRLPSRVSTLATLLKPKGYATGAFVGAFPLDSRYGLGRGFDVYDDAYPRGKPALDFLVPERPGTEVIAAALKWWRAHSADRRFLWVHLYDCHAPYRPPAPYSETYRDDPYLGEVASTDATLGPLLTPFLAGKSERPALVVVTADHGEARGDHGESTHGLFAYEATLRVPLVVWCAGAVAPGRSKEPVRHVDIAPTILAAAGVEKPAGWPGETLFPAAAVRRASYFESYSTAFNRGWAPLRGMLEGREKYIDLPIPELYDLERDSAEARNLAADKPEEVRRLARLIPAESAIGASAPRGPAGSEEVGKLRSLGYLSGGAALKGKYTEADDPKTLVGVDQRLHECVDLYQLGRMPEAIAAARDIVRDHPSMEMGYENLGFLLRQSGDSEAALSVYQKAVDAGVAGEELRRNYGLALCETGQPAEAVKLLGPLAGSEDPETINAIGIAFSDAGREKEARDAFARALALDPKNVEAYVNLGIVRLRSGDAAGARDRFRQALAIDPGVPRAWNGLGVALTRLGREREAVDAWSKAVALDPKLYDALFNLGLVAGKYGMRREAREALERFVAEAPPAQYGADIEKAKGLLHRLEQAGA